MPDSIGTVPELITAFGGPTAFSRVIGKGASTASEMKRARSIGIEYWPVIVRAAADQSIAGVTYETLVQMHVNSRAGSERAKVAS